MAKPPKNKTYCMVYHISGNFVDFGALDLPLKDCTYRASITLPHVEATLYESHGLVGGRKWVWVREKGTWREIR